MKLKHETRIIRAGLPEIFEVIIGCIELQENFNVMGTQVLRNEIGSAISQFFSRHENCILRFHDDTNMCHPSIITLKLHPRIFS